MPDLEKVIWGLEACNRWSHNGSDCKNCPYYDEEDTAELPFGICNIQDMFDDALALLKEQEARVMTVEEINKRAESLDPDPVFVQWRESGGTAWVVRSVNIIAGMVNAGNRSVRAWTSRPSEQQMRETPWEGDNDAE